MPIGERVKSNAVIKKGRLQAPLASYVLGLYDRTQLENRKVHCDHETANQYTQHRHD